MFVLNPDPYYLPCYRIGPFQTDDISRNNRLLSSDLIDNYLGERFAGKDYYYTHNGRQAIDIALSYYELDRDDIVTILTTTGNFYISSCVTNTIEKYCSWSREIQKETKLIFVNHEFGYPFSNISRLRKYNLPIIEDCASSFFSYDQDRQIGAIGDFVIYSFPKMFPLQIGGMLVAGSEFRSHHAENLQSGMLRHIKNVLSKYIQDKDLIIRQRITNYIELRSRFDTLGLPERFELVEGIVPGVFMFRTDSRNIDLPELKKNFWAHGIQSSVFYGENAFFIPVHQSLTPYDFDYFYEVMKSFLKKVNI